MERYKAFFYALAIISGVSLFFGFWPPIIFFLFGKNRLEKIGFLLIAFFSFIQTLYLSPSTPSNVEFGRGHFQLEKIKKRDDFYEYIGKLSLFITSESEFKNIPCTFNNKELIKLSDTFIIEGKIKPKFQKFELEIDRFLNQKKRFFFSYHRYLIKESVRKFLKSQIQDDTTYAFFASLATGEIESKILGLKFSKVGLSHTLAISGFHYTWLIFFLSMILNCFLNKRSTYFFLLFFVSFYFLFIGETPSLNRAWITAIIFIAGYLLKKPVSGINSLGVALVGSLILNPFALKEIGFQLSYLATFAILAIHPSLEIYLRKFFPKREPVRFHFVLINFIRNSLSLLISVHLATTSLLLYHFHYQSLLSLFFNLFFPFAMSLSMIGLLLSPLPYLGVYILKISVYFSKILLDMVYYGVDLMDFGIYVWNFPLDLLTSSLLLTMILGIWLEEKRYYLTRINSFM
jgi:competence protein ComEC